MVEVHTEAEKVGQFARLMRLGQIAHAEGDPRQAHLLWREAALLQPDNEQVWLALLQVLDDNDDRRVCLRNILAINPDNVRAQELLDELIGDTQPPNEKGARAGLMRRSQLWRVAGLLMRALQALVIGGLIALAVIVFRWLLL